MIDDLKEKYLEDICSVFPLHRILIAGIAVLASLAVTKQTHLSISETLWNLPLSGMSFESNGFFKNAQISNLGIGVFACIVSWFSSVLFNRFFFNWITNRINAQEKIATTQKRLAALLASSPLTVEQTDYLQMKIAAASKELGKLANFGELCLGLAIATLCASYWGNKLDIAIGVVLLALYLVSSHRSVLFFFKNYLKHDLIIRIHTNTFDISDYGKMNNLPKS